jgi:23S rRNA pseudouridine1911/1915/1917 synthase
MEDVFRAVEPGQEGQRLDQYLAQVGGGFSRSEIQRQIRAGRVSVGRRTIVQPSYRLRLGEKVSWSVHRPPDLTPAAIPLEVLYEDDDIVCISKPAGLVVHPGAGTREPTLVEALLAERELPTTDDPVRPGIVHRLDKETSGAIVVAKTPVALESLKKQFSDRTVRKLYLAEASGSITESEGLIDAPMGRDPSHPRRMAVQARGREAQTEFRVLDRLEASSLVLVRPRTGRTHQIRVHFKYIGHPIVGDAIYGGPPAPRLQLHAWRLEIDHPTRGERLRFEAPPPPELPSFPYEDVDRIDRAETK